MELMVIDGNSLVNRAFYGVRLLTAADGTPTNAVYGFLNMFFKLREDLHPEEICVCFDLKAPTFRHKAYAGYKAQRKPMPEELAQQMPLVKEALDLLGICRMEAEGFEADDLLGTLSHECAESGGHCTIVTGDRDSLQYVRPGVDVALVTTRMGQTSTDIYDEAHFAEKYSGLKPKRIVDLKAIMGDASDNIPGVKGIGEKGALDLNCRFGSLQGDYDHLEDGDMTASVKKKLTESREMAFLSYDLAMGVTDAPVPLHPGELAPRPMDEGGLYELLTRLELRTIVKRLELKPAAEKAAEPVEFTGTCTMEDVCDLQQAESACRAMDLRAGTVYIRGDESALVFHQEDGDDAYAYHLRKSDFEGDYDAALRLFFAPERKKAGHGCKALVCTLLDKGIPAENWVCDTALMAYLLDPAAGSYELEWLTQKYCGFSLQAGSQQTEEQLSLLDIPDEKADRAAESGRLASEAAAVACLEEVLLPKLEEQGMKELYETVELPLMPVLAKMQHRGVRVDRQRLLDFGAELDGKIAALEKQVYALAGREFKIGSPKQLGAVLFEELGLKAGKKTRTGYSTDAETLEKLRDVHDIIPAVLDWRKVTKLKSTYVEGLTRYIASDGRIHSNFHQTVTATGRLSSADPNLQNLPVRREDGSEIRKCFLPEEGWILADADYSQIELRVLAHMADDANMQSAFASGEDFHKVTAAQAFRVPVEEVTPRMRAAAKAVNFGIVYGISAWSLADDIRVSTKEAQDYIDAYLERYSGVKQFMEQVREDASRTGYVTTLYGRRRWLPELKSSNFQQRAFGQRAAMNAPIQGTAADIIKRAMVRVEDRLEKEHMRSRLILQVHDELILEVPAEEREKACAILQEEMEAAADLKVRLLAETSCGENWYDAKK